MTLFGRGIWCWTVGHQHGVFGAAGGGGGLGAVFEKLGAGEDSAIEGQSLDVFGRVSVDVEGGVAEIPVDTLDTSNAGEHRPVNATRRSLGLKSSCSDHVGVEGDEGDVGPLDEVGKASVQRELISLGCLVGEGFGLFVVTNANSAFFPQVSNFVSQDIEIGSESGAALDAFNEFGFSESNLCSLVAAHLVTHDARFDKTCIGFAEHQLGLVVADERLNCPLDDRTFANSDFFGKAFFVFFLDSNFPEECEDLRLAFRDL